MLIRPRCLQSPFLRLSTWANPEKLIGTSHSTVSSESCLHDPPQQLPLHIVPNSFFLPFLLFYCFSSTVVSILPPPIPSIPAIPTSHPRSYPLWFCPCVLHTHSWKPSSLFSPLPLPTSFLVTVHLFLNSVSLVILVLLHFYYYNPTSELKNSDTYLIFTRCQAQC